MLSATFAILPSRTSRSPFRITPSFAIVQSVAPLKRTPAGGFVSTPPTAPAPPVPEDEVRARAAGAPAARRATPVRRPTAVRKGFARLTETPPPQRSLR